MGSSFDVKTVGHDLAYRGVHLLQETRGVGRDHLPLGSLSCLKVLSTHTSSDCEMAQVAENGLLGSVLTLYELTTGGDLAPSTGACKLMRTVGCCILADARACVELTDFYELPLPILKLALAHLQKTGRAQTFRGTDSDGDGVKFF